MKYIFSDITSIETEKNDLDFLKEILKMPYQYWQAGTGDSSVQINRKESVIFSRYSKGLF